SADVGVHLPGCSLFPVLRLSFDRLFLRFFLGCSRLYFLSRPTKSALRLSDLFSVLFSGIGGSKISSDSGRIPFLFISIILMTSGMATGYQLASWLNPNHMIFRKMSVFWRVASPFLVLSDCSTFGISFNASMYVSNS